MDKILIVDDDIDFATRLKDSLTAQGYHVETAHNGPDGLQMLGAYKYAFALLDWNMPGSTGLEVCRQYRASGGKTPIIFLTGRDEIESIESGLDAGGDDYLTKPFAIRELLARIRSVGRRPANLAQTELAAQGLVLDPKLRVASCGAKQVQLSRREAAVLEFFLRNQDQYFSGLDVFNAVWPSEHKSGEDTVRQYVKFLREKLAQIGADSIIETKPGSGYAIRSKRQP